MALKSEFDGKTYLIVLIRSLSGAVLGAVPGVIYCVVAGSTPASSTFAVGLIQMGASVGAIAFGLAATAATIVSSIKNRGSNTQHTKARRLQEYLSPEQMPVIPPATKPDTKEPTTEKTEIKQPIQKTPASPETGATIPPKLVQSEQPSFQDYDRS